MRPSVSARGVLAGQRQQRGRAARHDAVHLQQREAELVRARALGAEREPLALELRQPLDHGPAIQDRERHVADAAERHESLVLSLLLDAALHEADIDLLRGVRQPCEIFGRALGFEYAQRHAVFRQDLLVALRRAPVRAAGRAGGDRERRRRRGLDQRDREPDRGDRQHDGRPDRHREIAPRHRDEAGDDAVRPAAAGGFWLHLAEGGRSVRGDGTRVRRRCGSAAPRHENLARTRTVDYIVQAVAARSRSSIERGRPAGGGFRAGRRAGRAR
ncbi:Uncharacterised protein [Burkholderia pseudomallei]|nr:Uncharacterised protein [Burkholderia pseudomallei]